MTRSWWNHGRGYTTPSFTFLSYIFIARKFRTFGSKFRRQSIYAAHLWSCDGLRSSSAPPSYMRDHFETLANQCIAMLNRSAVFLSPSTNSNSKRKIRICPRFRSPEITRTPLKLMLLSFLCVQSLQPVLWTVRHVRAIFFLLWLCLSSGDVLLQNRHQFCGPCTLAWILIRHGDYLVGSAQV